MLPFKHMAYEGERSFKCVTEKKAKRYRLMIPERQFFVQFVRFAAGTGPEDYVEHYREIDKALKGKYGKTRHQMGIHEIATFITLGRYDMVVLWDAPDMATYNKFMAAWPNPRGFGSSETQVVTTFLRHEVD
jgi:uncharacterized protein with GYD domain